MDLVNAYVVFSAVIIGYLIPAGTGLPRYRNLRLEEVEGERKADAESKTA